MPMSELTAHGLEMIAALDLLEASRLGLGSHRTILEIEDELPATKPTANVERSLLRTDRLHGVRILVRFE